MTRGVEQGIESNHAISDLLEEAIRYQIVFDREQYLGTKRRTAWEGTGPGEWTTNKERPRISRSTMNVSNRSRD
jgi:hypothetical protein